MEVGTDGEGVWTDDEVSVTDVDELEIDTEEVEGGTELVGIEVVMDTVLVSAKTDDVAIGMRVTLVEVSMAIVGLAMVESSPGTVVTATLDSTGFMTATDETVLVELYVLDEVSMETVVMTTAGTVDKG